MSDINGNSRWYRLGYNSGRLYRFAGIGIGLSALAYGLVEAVAPHSWRGPGEVVAIAIGLFFCATAVFTMRSVAVACFGLYIVLVVIGSVLQSHRPRPTAALIAIAAATIVTSVTGTLLAFLGGRQSKELDRLLFTESISVAFFVTMLFSLAYALLEVWIKAPKLSMWVVFAVGMWTWSIASSISSPPWDSSAGSCRSSPRARSLRRLASARLPRWDSSSPG
jgi:hypothetical protein